MNTRNLEEEMKHLKKVIKNLENYIQVLDEETYSRIEREASKIDYSDYQLFPYFSKKSIIRKQLEQDFRKMIRAKIKDDFHEFCRFAYLQIELMIDIFIKEKENLNQITVGRQNGKKVSYITSIFVKSTGETYRGEAPQKLKFCCHLIFSHERSENYQRKIEEIMDNRHFASHRDSERTETYYSDQ